MIKEIEKIFYKNNNKFMSSKEVYDALNNEGYKWGKNKRKEQGHKNMVSRDLSKRYKDKFDIDKDTRPQRYRLKMIENEKSTSKLMDKKEEKSEDTEFKLDINNLQFEEHTEIKTSKNIVKKKRNAMSIKKIDYLAKAKVSKDKGQIGEEAIIIFEKEKLRKLGREDLSEKVQWVSKERGDGLGYDIASWEINGEIAEEIYIEVKTTVGNINTPFLISDREVRVSEKLKEKYYIYRIFNLKKVNSKIDFQKIKGSINENFDLQPTTYRAFRK